MYPITTNKIINTKDVIKCTNIVIPSALGMLLYEISCFLYPKNGGNMFLVFVALLNLHWRHKMLNIYEGRIIQSGGKCMHVRRQKCYIY